MKINKDYELLEASQLQIHEVQLIKLIQRKREKSTKPPHKLEAIRFRYSLITNCYRLHLC